MKGFIGTWTAALLITLATWYGVYRLIVWLWL